MWPRWIIIIQCLPLILLTNYVQNYNSFPKVSHKMITSSDSVPTCVSSICKAILQTYFAIAPIVNSMKGVSIYHCWVKNSPFHNPSQYIASCPFFQFFTVLSIVFKTGHLFSFVWLCDWSSRVNACFVLVLVQKFTCLSCTLSPPGDMKNVTQAQVCADGRWQKKATSW